MSAHSLPRTERLRSLGAVRRLFESGESGFIFPFRYVWFAEPDTEQSVEVLFSVPKKFHKRANKRNLVRRRRRLRLLARLWNFLGTENSTSTDCSVSGSANHT